MSNIPKAADTTRLGMGLDLDGPIRAIANEDGRPECADDDCRCVRHCVCEDCGGRKHNCECEEDGDE